MRGSLFNHNARIYMYGGAPDCTCRVMNGVVAPYRNNGERMSTAIAVDKHRQKRRTARPCEIFIQAAAADAQAMIRRRARRATAWEHSKEDECV